MTETAVYSKRKEADRRQTAARQAVGVGACVVGTAETVREASGADRGAVVRLGTATKAAEGAAGAQLSARIGAGAALQGGVCAGRGEGVDSGGWD